MNKLVYTIEFQKFEDGTFGITRTNDGFNPVELLGVLTHSIAEINLQISGDIKPTIVERNVIK